MKPNLRAIALLSVLIITISPIATPAAAQPGDSQYFPESGHWVKEPFLSYYLQINDPESVFGYPITEAFIDKAPGASTGIQVQYFQKAQFSYNPEKPVGQEIELTKLGEIFQENNVALVVSAAHPSCRKASDWDFPICYSFLDFYDANGQESIFGKPISHLELLGTRVVQYYENARIEWHPDSPEGAKFKVANLGLAYFYLVGENINLLQPDQDNFSNLNVSEIQARGIVDKAIVPLNGEQTFFVIVTNQNSIPIKDANIKISVNHPSGKEIHVTPTLTDEKGLAFLSYQIDELSIGTATALIEISYGSVIKIIEVSFRIWF